MIVSIIKLKSNGRTQSKALEWYTEHMTHKNNENVSYRPTCDQAGGLLSGNGIGL